MQVTAEKLNGREDVTLTAYIQEPSQEMENTATKPAVLIFPGGWYQFTSDREAEPVALAFAAQGFQAFVLRYSVGSNARGFEPLKEASAAIAKIRDRGEQWHVVPDQIAVCGFSAGGHLAGAVSLFGSHRPNAAVLCYPAVDLGQADSEAAKDNPIIQSLIGSTFTQLDLDKGSLHKQVHHGAPPAFIWHTWEDEPLPADHSLKLAAAYADEGCPFELHIFQPGRHGLSLAAPITSSGRSDFVEPRVQAWFPMAVAWLQNLFQTP